MNDNNYIYFYILIHLDEGEEGSGEWGGVAGYRWGTVATLRPLVAPATAATHLAVPLAFISIQW